MARTTASLVCFRNDPVALEALWQSLASNGEILCWVAVDNSAHEDRERARTMRAAVERNGGLYVAAPRNLGFGGGHNLALRILGAVPSEFHVILNLDIVFEPCVLPELARLLETQPAVALAMPRVFYPDGNDQHLCKLLPTPFDFMLRRFAPRWLACRLQTHMERYELRRLDPAVPAEIPFLSGCFMFMRRSALEAVGGFDKRYFLYMEDVDLCRRLADVGSLLYWPRVSVVHVHERGSHKQARLMLLHLRSAIVYFNRWGWFFDATRRRVNRAALDPQTAMHQGRE